MTDSLHTRGQGFEAKHQFEKELQFKAECYRSKQVGLWAAEKIGFEGADAEAYAKTVVMSDLDEPGIEDVVRKVMSDFVTRSIDVSEAELRAEIERLTPIAEEYVKAEFKALGDDTY